jgi:hypothetical protein
MDFGLEDLQRNIAREQKAMQEGIAKEQRNLNKNITKDQKRLQREMSKGLKLSVSKEGRVPIPAKRRHEVEYKYHDRCAFGHKRISGVKLQIHHKNMKNNDNRLSNLELLCPNHHIYRHSKMFRRKYHSSTLMGTRVTTRLVKKGKKRTTKRTNNDSSLLMFKPQRLDFGFN